MANLNVKISEELHKKVKHKALEEDCFVHELVIRALTKYVE